MSAAAFLDTNVLIYAFGEAGRKTDIAEQLLARSGVISVQVLNEMASVARGKLGMSWEQVQQLSEDVTILCPQPRPLTADTHFTALHIAARYGYGLYDATILAAAMEAGCNTLYTEDMQHGQVIEGVRIENPFLLGSTSEP